MEVEHCTQLATFLQHTEHRHCLSSCGRHPPACWYSDLIFLASSVFSTLGNLGKAIYYLFAWVNEINLMDHLLKRGEVRGHAPDEVCDLVHPLLPCDRELLGVLKHPLAMRHVRRHLHIGWGQCGPLCAPAPDPGASDLYAAHLPGFVLVALTAAWGQVGCRGHLLVR